VDTSAGWGRPQARRVLSEGVAWKVTQVLGENALYGTGAGSGDGIHPNAGKTGTTDNHADAWFDGYTRDLSTVVWMGYPSGEIPMLNVHGLEVAGATFPVPIWHLYMAAAENGRRVRQFQTPNAYPVVRPFRQSYWGYLAIPVAPKPATTSTKTTTTKHGSAAATGPASGPAPGPAALRVGRPH
jgi:penicillin-binding protein 1A